MVTDFESAILEELGRLRAHDQQLVEQEVHIRQLRGELAQRVIERETALRIYRETMGIACLEPQSIPLGGEIPVGTVAEMAYAYLERQGGSASVGELVTFMIERGKFKRDGNRHGYYGTVFKTLSADHRFVKVPGKGRFHLAPNPERDKVKLAFGQTVDAFAQGVFSDDTATGGSPHPSKDIDYSGGAAIADHTGRPVG